MRQHHIINSKGEKASQIPFTDKEQAEYDSSQLKAGNAAILAEIELLEAKQTPRLIREAYLDKPGFNGKTARQKLRELDDVIAAKRVLLVK